MPSRAKSHGPIIRECPTKRTIIVNDQGQYKSASDEEQEARHYNFLWSFFKVYYRQFMAQTGGNT